MDYARLILKYTYYYFDDASNVAMIVLGRFFSTDIGCDRITFFKDWALENIDGSTCGGNCTRLENENNFIIITDEYSVEPTPTQVRMTVQQFAQLFDEWQEKAVNQTPKQVIIKHEHGKFFIETSEEWDPTAAAVSIHDDQFLVFLRKNFEMNYAKIAFDSSDGSYEFLQSACIPMAILGHFFAAEIGNKSRDSFRDWVLTSIHGDYATGEENNRRLERDSNDILLCNKMYQEKVRIPLKQFVQLFDEWQEKVVKVKAREIVIKHERGQYSIEIFR